MMFAKDSVLLFVAGWLLLAVLLLPAQGSAVTIPPTTSLSMVSSDTFPLFDNLLVVRQAHLAWLAAKEEVGMQATIGYIASHNGATGTLTSLMVKADTAAIAMSSASTDAELNASLRDLREIAGMFSAETQARVSAIHGNPDDLRGITRSETGGSAEVKRLEARYWQTRETADLADFDQRLVQAGKVLATVPANEHGISAARQQLGEIAAMRTDLAATLEAHDDTGIEMAYIKIHAASITYAQAIQDIRAHGSDNARLADSLDQCAMIMTRADRENANLTHAAVNTTGPEHLVALGKEQIASARDRISAGDAAGATSFLPAVGNTTAALRDSYRHILVSEDLPQPVEQDLLSITRSLDTTTGRVNGSEMSGQY